MTSRSGRVRLASEATRTPLVPNSVLGMTLFVASETMLFGGMISAFVITRSSAVLWPPLGQPRLPFAETAVNTAALLLSGVFLYLAQRAYTRDPSRALRPLGITMLLGGFFVLFQGAEWVALVREGLTFTSSTMGSFFYLIVGLHALHAVVAIGLLSHTWSRLRRGWCVQGRLAAAQVCWYFVVGVWPLIYLVVYL